MKIDRRVRIEVVSRVVAADADDKVVDVSRVAFGFRLRFQKDRAVVGVETNVRKSGQDLRPSARRRDRAERRERSGSGGCIPFITDAYRIPSLPSVCNDRQTCHNRIENDATVIASDGVRSGQIDAELKRGDDARDRRKGRIAQRIDRAEQGRRKRRCRIRGKLAGDVVCDGKP